MSKINIFMPCKDANHVCNKSQYNEASIWEKVILNIHLIYCRACRKYSKNNATLTKIIETSEVACLDKNTKETMRENLKKALDEN